MSERDSNIDGIRINAPLGLNQRAAPNALPAGEWDKLEGCYPAKTGMLERIPGKELLMKLSSPILAIHQTNDGSGNILVQTRDALHRFTLDELLGRAAGAPSLTYTDGGGDTPGEDTTEETMSMAILVHRESNASHGGSIAGVVTGTDTSSVAGTFYRRRLTDMVVNESSTVQVFNPAAGGLSGSVSTGGTFQLADGSYRIRASLVFCSEGNNLGFVVGLFNETGNTFQVQTDGASPIIGTSQRMVSGTNMNAPVQFSGAFTVSGGPIEFSIKQKAGGTGATNSNVRQTRLCGRPSDMTTADVLGAAAQEHYAYVEIYKTA